jgi:hypothetical protein
LVPPPLPHRLSAGATGNEQVPATPQFRKMAIFVQKGRVIRIMEAIDVLHKVTDLEHNFGLKLNGDLQAQSQQALAAINAVRKGQGQDLIRVRQMDFQLSDLGASLAVDLPTEYVQGPLTLLENRGYNRPGSGAGTSSVPVTGSGTTAGGAPVLPSSTTSLPAPPSPSGSSPPSSTPAP